jgi:hypothetical protein
VSSPIGELYNITHILTKVVVLAAAGTKRNKWWWLIGHASSTKG